MLIPKAVCFKSLRTLSFYNPTSSIGSLFMNLVSPAVQEAPAPQPPEAAPAAKPILDLNKIVIEPAHLNVADEIKTFLHRHHFKYQPGIAHLAKPLDRSFLDSMAEKFSTTGDRWVAYQLEPRMRTRTVVGALAGYKKYSWEATKLENWALWNPNPERYFAYFLAHCYRNADLFTKYKIPYIYDIELLATSSKVKGMGVEDMLLRTAIMSITESNHYPLIQVLSTDRYTSDAATRSNMVLEWSTKLSAIGDENGMCMFRSENAVVDEMAAAEMYIRLMTPKRKFVY